MLSASPTLPEGVTLIVLTGGPCAGKSTFSVHLRTWLEESGFRVAIANEVATELIMSGFSPLDASFQEVLLVRMLQNEQALAYLLSQQEGKKGRILICDRGALDSIAYIGADAFARVAQSLELTVQQLRDRYRAVVHLVTAADGAEEFYSTQNNQARTETPEQARALDKKTREAWIAHNRFLLVGNNPGQDFATKMKNGLKGLARVLNMPEPLEAEHKYLWGGVFSPDILGPFEPRVLHIIQTYLVSTQPETSRRVRSITVDGAISYYYAEKSPGGTVGVRVERERVIDAREYEMLLAQRDPKTLAIIKTRYAFVYLGRKLELDVFSGLHAGLVTLEVEVSDMAEPVLLPEGWPLREVTDDHRFSNHEFARHGIPI